ncbi:MAG: hypothetical protein AMJ79_01520 [Phycisphaerae bacterium SM23_30]|nr:MAG: hypothetical protein AMJ79_01520 [Phycisphaerae bacterium SM23_30]
MNVVFVYFDFMKGAEGKYHEGIASLSAYLKLHHHTARLFHITERITCDRFIEIFEEKYRTADLVAFSATTNAFCYAADYAAQLKKRRNVLTICGGIHPTLHPEEAIAQPGLDIICLGEGERPLQELCDRLEGAKDISSIQSLWIKKDGKIFKNPVRPLMEDLDSLPPADRELFDYESTTDYKLRRLAFMGSRGCPFQCTYCCNHALRKIYPNKRCYVRFKSVDRLLREIKQALNAYNNVESIMLHDDILTLNRRWFAEFARRYPREINVPYVCNSRFDLLNEEICDQLHKSGCIRLQLGLESGDAYIRNDILKRNQDEEQILRISELCRQKGIEIYAFTMVGIPFENLRRSLKTVKLTAKIRPVNIQTTIYYPYPKTQLYEICRENGFLTDKKLDSLFEGQTVLNLPDYPESDILFACRNFKKTTEYYRRAYEFSRPGQIICEKLLDFLWMRPRLYNVMEPLYRKMKKAYKALKNDQAQY